MSTFKKFIPPDPRLDLPQTLQVDQEALAKVKVPIATTSASFKSDIARVYGEKSKDKGRDIVFSRGHFSMSIALFRQAHEMNLTSWLVDPVNYVTAKDWGKLKSVVFAGHVAARFPIVKKIKDMADTLIRGKLPLAEAIKIPLLYATSNTTQPIISVHYEIGNILVREGRRVLQVLTDPHVRPQYLLEASRENISFVVFNQDTKAEFLAKAKEANLEVDENRVIVSGPPVDPRIVRARKGKKLNWIGKRPLRLAVTTGGLGQNQDEICKLLENICPLVKTRQVQVILYASTLPDFRQMYENILVKHEISWADKLKDKTASARIIYSPSIVEANQSLIEHGFSWADGFVTKPSGDMAYDAAAAGCFILSLEPWGDWEVNVQKIFTDLAILKQAEPENFAGQIRELLASGWIRQAINNALRIDKLYLTGSKNIIKLQQKLAHT
ncbi:MAG: hypothetical protein A2782_00885 [Candidatus Blackburnbacteria bacterium RIFCSPHIGHO2_01_FULL_43_15b]|uniref:Glycosyl transferase family 1 domain-containing protein n=1 Tax=Candidatus Blackburnbacteria bacterium RIFCSPHIGHO2_01_FULL_43_15b TaxID=1797513 RepID=A0A1G1V0W7_9BACT|nr:MAG: hypothetical protein A2782_00885 [Candidatus Blackburnbacteria bacterium RIFCSPHIGHO2_01_FULL_43_15b]